MNKIVYLVNPKTEPVKKSLVGKAFDVIVGDGKVSEEYLAKCWAMIPGKEPVTEAILEKAPMLKLIVKKGVGMDRIDIDACTKRGICVANTPFSNYISVAEHTFALLMAAAKKLYPTGLAIHCDEPDAKCMYKYPPTELYGKTLSVIGLGNIGLRVVKLAAGFEMNVVAYVRHPEKVSVPDGVRLTTSMDEALAAGDFVSLHVSGVESNRNLIRAREIGLMKKTAVLINTTRGFVVDETALCNALNEGRIAGAALDVVASEPIKGNNPLLAMKNVVMTPHCAGYTPEANARGYEDCAKIIADYAEGIYPPTACNQVTMAVTAQGE